MPAAVKPQTSRRGAPHQERSQKTLELILSAAAELLEDVGFERLSTNTICGRAGLTPPALYRYFPNKYAVLKELGERLMAKQNAILEAWTDVTGDFDSIEEQIRKSLSETIDVTRNTRAGVWIMRALHATPILADVRIASHRHVSQILTDQVLQMWPDLNRVRTFESMRLGVEMGYALVEMIFDECELDEDALVENAAKMLTGNIQTLVESET